jgi:hypothetical protein
MFRREIKRKGKNGLLYPALPDRYITDYFLSLSILQFTPWSKERTLAFFPPTKKNLLCTYFTPEFQIKENPFFFSFPRGRGPETPKTKKPPP